MKTCALQGCNKRFKPKKRTQKFCCAAHGKTAANRVKTAAPLPERTCSLPACEKAFRPGRSSQKFCSTAHATKARNDGRNSPDAMTEQDAIALLQGSGYRVSIDRPQEQRIKLAPKKTKHHRFGVVSDTHMGSKYQQLTYLHEFYDLCSKEGIDTVLHVGDLVHGSPKMHRDMILESFVHGADAQVDYAAENYPKREGIKTLLIAGNHDTSFWEDSGSDVVSHFCQQREDATYLGQRGAYVEFGSASVYLWHPRGGGSYALSYRLQKWIEQVSPDAKPHMVLVGHWHSPVHIPAYRNVEALRLPCYQSQTPFEKTLGLHPVVGGMLMDLWTSDEGIEDLQTRWVLRRVPKKADY